MPSLRDRRAKAKSRRPFPTHTNSLPSLQYLLGAAQNPCTSQSENPRGLRPEFARNKASANSDAQTEPGPPESAKALALAHAPAVATALAPRGHWFLPVGFKTPVR